MRQCCPTDTFLVPGSSFCSDNATRYILKCQNGALLLDPTENEIDKFKLVSNGTIIVFDGEQRSEDQFCLGTIQRNESSISSNSVALVCFDNQNDVENSKVISILLRLLMIVSTFFLLCTLYIYMALPNLRDLQGKCVIAFICCLISSYTTLLVIQTFPNSSKATCVIQAAVLYFFMCACFFWNNVITFSIWKAISIADKSLTIIYFCWGFGGPFVMVLISFILEYVPGEYHVRPRFAETKCWFKGKVESWNYFHGPVSALLIINLIMFIQSCWTLWKISRDSSASTFRSLKFKCLMYLKLFLLMGITWIFEMISYATSEMSAYGEYLWLLTDCINSSQGVLIFLILVIFRQKVKVGLYQKKVCGISWPQSWMKDDIEESSAFFFEDFEMEKQKVQMIRTSQTTNDVD
ncbi:hypothetical protein RUM43_007288 [Polyplax serrata]|uniref:G-protein coupled receptors family 2 profile 2 domain-containing protein n=1 Tax=Polyplax serrata TaxID=468196 RepID=A0AAN8S1E6_POLSC